MDNLELYRLARFTRPDYSLAGTFLDVVGLGLTVIVIAAMVIL